MDTILFEKAGDILPLLAQAVGGEAFKPYFEAFFPLLVKRTVFISTRLLATLLLPRDLFVHFSIVIFRYYGPKFSFMIKILIFK